MNHPRTDEFHRQLMNPLIKVDEYAAMRKHAEKLEEELLSANLAKLIRAIEAEHLREELAVARAMR